MKIFVQGLWHLGCVTAACCARHFDVTGLDFDEANLARLRAGRAPLLEPGLDELLAAGLTAGRLRFTNNPSAVRDADVLWVTYDTPVNESDESEVAAVLTPLRRALPHLRAGAIVLISAQLPVGTCRALEREFPSVHFASSPENLRLGKALDSFEKAERAIVGTRDERPRAQLQQLFAPFTPQVLFMRTESAEMVKHGINSFLALSITFINELARLCEHVGADAKEVSHGLKSEPRIGPKSYLGPGGPFAGGTLARDVVTLTQLGAATGEKLSVLPAIKQSNDLHRGWALRRLQARLGPLSGHTVALLGLVYTPGTNTLRRSSAVELARALLAEGAVVRAHDPAQPALPAELSAVDVGGSVREALLGADAVVVCTEWPEFRTGDWPTALAGMRQPIVIDANRFLEKTVAMLAGVEFLSVGRA